MDIVEYTKLVERLKKGGELTPQETQQVLGSIVGPKPQDLNKFMVAGNGHRIKVK